MEERNDRGVIKRESLSVPILLIIIVLGTVFYHNGVNNQCPFCNRGIAISGQLNESTYNLFVVTNGVSVKITEQTGILLLDVEQNFSTRAPPEHLSYMPFKSFQLYV